MPICAIPSAVCSWIFSRCGIASALIALRQQRVSQQLVRSRQVRSQFHRVLERRDGGAVILIFHVGLAEIYKAVWQLGRELGDFLEFRNRDIEVPLLIGFCARLQMLQRFGRNGLPRQPNCQKNADHGFSGSTDFQKLVGVNIVQ